MDDLALRLGELERRVAMLEQRLMPRPQPPLPPPRHPQSPRLVEADSKLGLTWLNRAGAVVIIAGLALAALWAHQRGLLGPPLRNALAALVGLGVFALGSRAVGSGDPARRGFGVGVAAVGAFTLYLVPFMAGHVDRMVPPAAGAAAALAITAAFAFLAVHRREPLYALFATLGAASYASAAGHTVALLPIGALAAGFGLALSLELLLLAGALVLVCATPLLLGLAALPIGGLVLGGLVAQAGALRRWTVSRAIALGVATASWMAIVAMRRGPITLDELALHALAILALDGIRRGVLDRRAAASPRRPPDRRSRIGSPRADFVGDPSRGGVLSLLGWIATNLVVLVCALRIARLELGASLVFAAHGLALMTIGVWKRHLATRILGLVLLGLALVKALVVDVWRQDLGLRVIAFLALGAALLFASFLYSRLERRIR
jgi:hypothetical protein